jgi:hypothetical protein
VAKAVVAADQKLRMNNLHQQLQPLDHQIQVAVAVQVRHKVVQVS